MVVKYNKERLNANSDFADFVSSRQKGKEGSWDAALSGFATQLWNENTQDYYAFELAKKILLATPMKAILKLAYQLEKQATAAWLLEGGDIRT